MIKIGSNNIGKIYFGNNSIGKAYLGSNLVYQKESELVPYDARVSYIESSGTQYINLDVLPTNDTSVTIDLVWPYVSNTEIIGARSSSRYYEFLYSDYGSSASLFYQYGRQTPRTSSFVSTNRNVYKSEKTAFYINDANVMNAPENTFSIIVPLCLFCLNNSGTKERFATAKVYSVKIYQDQTLVRNMIPVRVGQEGYLYDKVSKQLFGNLGGGSFVIGPDI